MASVAEREARRSTLLIFLAGALGSTGIFALITVAPLLAEHLAGTDALAGIPAAAGTAGTAIAVFTLSRIMARTGRTIGLRIGYLVGALGCIAAILAVQAGSFPLAVVAILASSPGFAAFQLGRFAAAELHPAERRALVVGWIVWGATVGALIGPHLPGQSERIAASLGLDPINGGFLAAAVSLTIGFVVTMRLPVRPPLTEPGEHGEHGEPGEPGTAPVRVRTLLRGRVRRALIAIVGAQATMVMVMAVTPVHLRDAGHDLGAVGAVMSAHFVGMFALAPVAGRIVASIGIMRAMPAGLVLLLVSAVTAGATSGEHAMRIGIELFALGLGWSLTFVAASTAFTAWVAVNARIRVQGVVDACAWTSSAIASITGGALLDRAGYPTLGVVAAGVAIVALLGSSLRIGAPLQPDTAG